MRVHHLLFIALIAACTTTPEADDVPCTGAEYLPGMVATGAAGATIALSSAAPAPPARFVNTWTIVATDPNGAPVPASAVEVATFMPAHGHGGRPVTVTEGPPPTLVITPIDLWMPGQWDIRFSVSYSGGIDRAQFTFCIPE